MNIQIIYLLLTDELYSPSQRDRIIGIVNNCSSKKLIYLELELEFNQLVLKNYFLK